MKLFPTIQLKFKLFNSKNDSIERLSRRTEYAEKMTSAFTDKSFRGVVKDDEFRIISSEIGKGAFCVMTGKIENETGYVKVEINSAFKKMLSFILALPLIGLIVNTIQKPEDFIVLVLVMFGQLLIIRFLMIGLAFKFMSSRSLNKLRDTLDIEYFN